MEGHGGVEPLGVREDLERERDRGRLQLLLHVLERALHGVPKVDLLRGAPARHVPVQFRERLHGAHPAVHVAVQLVHERVVREQCRGLHGLHAHPPRLARTPLHRVTHHGVHVQLHLRDLDVLLQLQQAQLQLGKLALRHGHPCAVLVLARGAVVGALLLARHVRVEPRGHDILHDAVQRLVGCLEQRARRLLRRALLCTLGRAADQRHDPQLQGERRAGVERRAALCEG